LATLEDNWKISQLLLGQYLKLNLKLVSFKASKEISSITRVLTMTF
jgi:hypothetical protein